MDNIFLLLEIAFSAAGKLPQRSSKSSPMLR